VSNLVHHMKSNFVIYTGRLLFLVVKLGGLRLAGHVARMDNKRDLVL
jgi:hypothetical protein